MESQILINEAVKELVERSSQLRNLESLKEAYRSKNERMNELLVKAGGEAEGWRLARGLIKTRTAKQLRTEQGIVAAIQAGGAANGLEEKDSDELKQRV